MTHSASSLRGKARTDEFLFFLTIFDEIFEGANESRCGAGTESESETICWLVIRDTLVSYHIDIQAPFGLSSSYHKTLNSVRVIFSDSFESLLFSYNFFYHFSILYPEGVENGIWMGKWLLFRAVNCLLVCRRGGPSSSSWESS